MKPGGIANTIRNDASYSTIAGGAGNLIDQTANATIGGGNGNEVTKRALDFTASSGGTVPGGD